MEQRNAWIYCRIDAPEDTHGALKGQYEQLERYAEQMGFTVVGSSRDLGSGTHKISTGLQTAIDAAKTGAFSILLVTSIARLERESVCVEPICYTLAYHDIHVLAAGGQRERPERSRTMSMQVKTIFDEYPDIVEVELLCKMLGGISKKLAYRLLSENEIHSVRVGRSYKIPKVCIIDYLIGENLCHITLKQ